SRPGRRCHQLPASDVGDAPLSRLVPTDHLADAPPPLPEVGEIDLIRHFTNLSARNMSIDTNFYPLGSCTMKYNPKRHERLAALPGFAELHPLQDDDTVQGMLELLHGMQEYLAEISGLPAVSLQPAAGAQGELTGILMVKAYHHARGDTARTEVLVPDSAHGTNPATAALIGFVVKPVPAREDGWVHVEDVKERLGPDVAAIMLTNPNTCGLFEPQVAEIAKAIHDAGAYFYCDGANFNAIVGKAKPGDLGVDAMHINLHKTFSTPHGGGGPGAGPVVFSEALAPYAPVPYVVHGKTGFDLVEHDASGKAFGRLKGFHGQMGMFVRALAYMMSHGSDGLRQASGDAVLNANYILAGLKDELTPAFEGTCMHEALFNDGFLEGTGVTTLDFAKAMIDEGYHPMTMYFPLVVHGAMLIEPTESESKASLDLFVAALRDLAMAAKRGDAERFSGAPYHAPRRRLDETRAARQPILKWAPPKPLAEAAE
ncbi:MAG: aminomethyl-transferring glycine dehydrogenase subunit GcvPB, partial [Microvirga sp.]